MASHDQPYRAGEAKGRAEEKTGGMADTMKEKAQETKEKTNETAEQAREKAAQKMQEAKEAAEHAKQTAAQKTSETLEATKQKTYEGKEKTQGVLHETGEKVKHMAESAAESVKSAFGMGGGHPQQGAHAEEHRGTTAGTEQKKTTG